MLQQEHIIYAFDSKNNIITIIIFNLSLTSLSVPDTDKRQYFVHLSFNSTLQEIIFILNDVQNLLKYFNDTPIVAFFRIPLTALSSYIS